MNWLWFLEECERCGVSECEQWRMVYGVWRMFVWCTNMLGSRQWHGNGYPIGSHQVSLMQFHENNCFPTPYPETANLCKPTSHHPCAALDQYICWPSVLVLAPKGEILECTKRIGTLCHSNTHWTWCVCVCMHTIG